jgi:hypothetical protein
LDEHLFFDTQAIRKGFLMPHASEAAINSRIATRHKPPRDHAPSNDPSVFDLPEFCVWGKISRSTAFEEIAKGRLIVRRVGRKSLVTIEAARAWLNSLPTNRCA